MQKIFIHARRRCAKVLSGAINTTKQAGDLSDNEVFSCPKFMVLDVGRAYPQGWPHNLFCVDIPHVHSADLSSRRMVFLSRQGAETMTTIIRATAHTTSPTGTSLADALRSILAEVTPGTRPYSGDSYLPHHLVDLAAAALAQHDCTATQHAFNALSTAAYHCARGEPGKALARMRRAQSHITTAMQGGAI
jgi:hypothetical protein